MRKKLAVSAVVIAAVAAATGLTASPARADMASGTFVISDTVLLGCHAAGTLNENGSITTVGGCFIPNSAPGGGTQIFTGGTWSGSKPAGVTVCFTFITISGPVYPTPFCVGPLPVNTGPEVIPDPGGGTGTTLIDINLG